MRPRRVKITSEETRIPSTGAGRRRMLSTLRWPLAIAVVLLVGAGILSAVNLHLLLKPERLQAWVTPRLSAALNRKVAVQAVSVTMLPRPAVKLRNLRVENSPGFDGPALAELGEAQMDVAWLPLLVGRVSVRRVSIDGARIYLGVDSTGATNFGDLVPQGRAADTRPADMALQIGISHVDVKDADLTYFDALTQRSFAISGGRARAVLAPDAQTGWRGAVAVSSDSMQLRAADLTDEIVHMDGPGAAFTLRGDRALTWVQIEEGTVRMAGESLALAGRVDAAGSSPAYDLHLTNDSFDASALTAVLPASERSSLVPHLEGTLGVALRMRGGPDAGGQPVLSGAIVLRDVSARVSGEPVVDQLNGMLAFTPATISLDSIAGTFAGGPIQLSGAIGREQRALALVVHARPDLDRLDRLGVLPDGTTLSGNAVLDLSVAGPLEAPDSIQVLGSASLDGVQAKSDRFGVPVYVAAGDLSFVGQDVSWSDLSVLVGRDALTTSGTVQHALAPWSAEEDKPVIDVSLAGPRLDLDAVFPPHADSVEATYAQVAFAHLGERQLDGRSASAIAAERGLKRPERLPADGTIHVDVDTLRYRGSAIDSLSAALVLSDSAVSVDNASFRAWEGHARGSLHLGLGPLRDEPFELKLTLADANAGPFLSAMTPIDSAVSGRMTLDLELQGMMDPSLLPVAEQLKGHARVTVEDGSVHGTGMNLAVADFLEADAWKAVPFEEWTLDLQVEDNVVEIRRADLSGDLGQVAFTGLVDLSGSSDLSVGLSIPPKRLNEVSLRRTGIGQSVLDQLRAVGSPLDLGLQVSGPIYAPTLEPDASHAVVLARR